MFNFRPIKSAELTQGEFASLVGVTRTTANLWVVGKMNPNRYIRDHVAAVLAAITQAIENDQLPLPANTPRAKRAGRLCEVIRDNRAATSNQ